MSDPHATLDLFGVAWRLGATLFFVLLNGFFVAAEFGLVKVRSSRIEELAEQGGSSARLTQHILGHLDRYLSACQLGITLASLILGALGEPAVSRLLLALAGSWGLEVSSDAAWLPIVSITLAFAIITVLHMVLGEQAPKMWALRRAEGTALFTARPLRLFALVFGPFIGAINGLSNSVLRLFGLPAEMGHEGSHTAEEIRSILSLSASAGHISERELELTENVFRMIELEVRHIVVPRVDVEWLSLERGHESNMERIATSAHSRLPLCDVGLDTVVGFVHKKDVLGCLMRGEPVDLRALARKPIVVPDTMPLSNFLLELQSEQAHCAAVVDEHGTVIGLAFREDALEEIVGPLGDEFHAEEPDFVELGPGRYEVTGRVSVPEICDRLDFELSDEEYEDQDTIGGHVTARLGRLPRRGDTTRVGPFRATVLEIARRRVRRLRLEREEPVEEERQDASVL